MMETRREINAHAEVRKCEKFKLRRRDNDLIRFTPFIVAMNSAVL
jgi:hypothetical protein